MIDRTPPLPRPLKSITAFACLLITLALSPLTAFGVDDGTQMQNRFRINYAGYLPQAHKIALYLSDNKGSINWKITGFTSPANKTCRGTEDTYIANDIGSGDSFYKIDFSHCTQLGNTLILHVGKDTSPTFDISNDPYGTLKYEFFDYFRDHQGQATFNQTIHNWNKDLNVTFNYVKDAGDNGVYPVNTAEAAWALINMLETYPNINTYYSSNLPGAYTVYQQLKILTEPFNHVFAHGGKLAISKFHTNVNTTWAACTPHVTGTCISKPETKATFATARTLAAMSRLHTKYGTPQEALNSYTTAKQALKNAQTEPLTCRQAQDFGGEGGMYPDNDNYSDFRDPQKTRNNCIPGKDNTQDDEYTALVETYLAAIALKQKKDIKTFKKRVQKHPRFNEASSYWWGAVAMEGSLSLLTHEAAHNIRLKKLKRNIVNKAKNIMAFQQVGYPGVTWDVNSNFWDSNDQDDVDNNFRWGSHRMALNDARILMAAAEIQKVNKKQASAAHFARAAIQVLDHISGINAINIAMYTAQGYPYIENAITRTHDGANTDDSWSGKMVLGPNNWTNANDSDMPKFGSMPGLKMFALTGIGWASREISIDANASLVPVAYFATEVAPAILANSPLPNTQPDNNSTSKNSKPQ